MKIALTILCFFCCIGESLGQRADDIRMNFLSPPENAKPKLYWWWLNGDVDTTQLKKELHLMKEAGIGGVDIFEIGVFPEDNTDGMIKAGPPFMGTDFLKSLKVALDKAKELKMEVGMSVASSWNAGGSWVRPEHAAKTLYSSKTEINAASGSNIILPFPEISENDTRGRSRLIQYTADKKPVYYEEVVVLAIPKVHQGDLDTTNILNLTYLFDQKSERLSWTPKSGSWEVYRYVCANSGEHLFLPSPNSVGPIIDHYDSLATAEHINYFINRLKPLVGGDFTKSALKYLYLASYEATDFAWSAGLPAKFRSLNGYDIYKFIPALFNNKSYNPKLLESFRFDLRKTFSEMMINNHYKKAREICNANGLKIISEAGGPGVYNIPVETLKALGSLDIPRGEFWYKTQKFNQDGIDIMWLVKEIAAASHIYKQGIVEEEAFTSMKNWQEGPRDLKIIADRAFCEGMNRLVIHGFPHNPKADIYPGIGYFAGTHYNDRQVWWSKVKPFHEYLSRISHILQNSRFAADVLYYYGEEIPNLIPPKNTQFKAGTGYDYEVINTEVLLKDLKVEHGEWVLPGVGRYKILSIGKGNRIGTQVRQQLEEWRRQGGIITESENITNLGIPADFKYGSEEKGLLDFIHYQKGQQDFYLIRNTTDQWVKEQCSFRQTLSRPEIWDPVTGKIFPVTVYNQSGSNHTNLELTLPPYGTYFVVFDKNLVGKSSSARRELYPSISQTDILKGNWHVTFSAKWGGPQSTAMDSLVSWTESRIAGIKYYSGDAVYSRDFHLDKNAEKGERVFLDLGELSKIASVKLNGKSLGITWTPPFRYEISDLIKTGKNTVKIEVSNVWSNRLTGDAILNQHFTNTNLKAAVRGKNPVSWGKMPLVPSGLFGPVTILRYNQKEK
ncbi:Putative beta-glucuronidase [Dyadobacter sp. CECT 9275]|uniref:Beta-glucuronidase n=1 Tax=Dyadobacter helix TaxID=2822344 RepID=A0A916JHT1_9BACT|nr:glycosyl hydrolase [Dyadobacter sp. CECT 9275]CAG5018349.1 Putative beta-glucuronidase [Dyadobacter sp. CECT 9275]